MFVVTLEVADVSLGELLKHLMVQKYVKVKEAAYVYGDENISVKFGEAVSIGADFAAKAREELGLGKTAKEQLTGLRKPPRNSKRDPLFRNRQIGAPAEKVSLRSKHRDAVWTIIKEVRPGYETFAPYDIKFKAIQQGVYKSAFNRALADLRKEGLIKKVELGVYKRIE